MLLGDTTSKHLCCLIMKQDCQFSDGHREFCGHPGRALHFYGLRKFRKVTIEPGKNVKRKEMEYVSKFIRSQCGTHEE